LSSSDAAQPAQSAQSAPADADKPPFKQEELEQMLAPLALYPDSLLSQILMASTYPLEIVQAERWVKANQNLKGDAMAKALEEQDWDPSVKSLVNFPDVLAMLSDKLDWTEDLGDAFIGQQKEVMDTIQKLRGKAEAAGQLQSTAEQTVTVEPQGQSQVIVIEPASPEVIYVPAYNPTVVYGGWPYPSYPPYPYHPPGYVLGTAAVSFGLGVACGAAWGYAWGDCDWHHGDIDIDFDRNLNFNSNINRNNYINNRNNFVNDRGSWKHDPQHRRGASYRDQATARKYGGASSREAAQAREAYRGRAESGRRDLAAGDAGQVRDRGGTDRSSAAGRDRAGADRAGADRMDRGANSGGGALGDISRSGSHKSGAGADNRGSGGSRGSSAGAGSRDSGRGGMSGVDRGGQAARSSSSRGQASRGGGAARGGGARGGGARGGGGGRR
jgi:hypothetical protein